MQRERGGRYHLFDMGDAFSAFEGFDGFGTFRSNLFGGSGPFDDPFFTRPFGSRSDSDIFGSSASSGYAENTNNAKGVLIEELSSDGEGEKENEDTGRKHSAAGKEPSVEHPEDDGEERQIQNLNQRSDCNREEGTQSQACSVSVQACKVTYGGIDGAYYTSTRTRRIGSDGVVLEESKEADKTTGQATHRISKGIHDKGHSVTRKLNSDGRVDTMQTLHNLHEDELAGFEEAWKGNVKTHLPGWISRFSMHRDTGSGSGEQKEKTSWEGWMLPALKQTQNAGRLADNRASIDPSRGRTKKAVRINIE